MSEISIDHNNTRKKFNIPYGDIDAGDSKTVEVTVNNDSQFDMLVGNINTTGDEHIEILNPAKTIKKNSSYIFKIKITVPLDIREPIKGKFHIDGRYIME